MSYLPTSKKQRLLISYYAEKEGLILVCSTRVSSTKEDKVVALWPLFANFLDYQ